jgi:hypothetical protein
MLYAYYASLLKNEITQVVGASLLAKALDFASPASWLLHLECPKPSISTGCNLEGYNVAIPIVINFHVFQLHAIP